MKPLVLRGLNGSSPLDFMATIGLMRLIARDHDSIVLGFHTDGSYQPFVEGLDPGLDLPELVARDAAVPIENQGWWLTYDKQEKKGIKAVADLKAPPEVFKKYLRGNVDRWRAGDNDPIAYAAAFGTDIAVDGKGNTKPTGFHFTAANQQFLDQVDSIRRLVTSEWVSESLFEGRAFRPGSNLRWDPAAERNWALMATNPVDGGTAVNAPVEWLAFRGLPAFPTLPCGIRVVTTAIRGRGDDMAMIWPLWSPAASFDTIKTLVNMEWTHRGSQRSSRGIFAICKSEIRRTNQGFGNFGPAIVVS